MKKSALILLFPLFIYSCNDAKDDKEDKSLQKVSLNDQSLQCIAIMNRAGNEKAKALTAGDNQKAAACQATIDSAAKENALIGQQLLEIDKEGN